MPSQLGDPRFACVACPCANFVQGLTPQGAIIATASDFGQECIGCDHAYYQHRAATESGMKGASMKHECGGFVPIEGEAIVPRTSCCAACHGPWKEHDTVLPIGSHAPGVPSQQQAQSASAPAGGSKPSNAQQYLQQAQGRTQNQSGTTTSSSSSSSTQAPTGSSSSSSSTRSHPTQPTVTKTQRPKPYERHQYKPSKDAKKHVNSTRTSSSSKAHRESVGRYNLPKSATTQSAPAPASEKMQASTSSLEALPEPKILDICFNPISNTQNPLPTSPVGSGPLVYSHSQLQTQDIVDVCNDYNIHRSFTPNPSKDKEEQLLEILRQFNNQLYEKKIRIPRSSTQIAFGEGIWRKGEVHLTSANFHRLPIGLLYQEPRPKKRPLAGDRTLWFLHVQPPLLKELVETFFDPALHQYGNNPTDPRRQLRMFYPITGNITGPIGSDPEGGGHACYAYRVTEGWFFVNYETQMKKKTQFTWLGTECIPGACPEPAGPSSDDFDIPSDYEYNNDQHSFGVPEVFDGTYLEPTSSQNAVHTSVSTAATLNRSTMFSKDASPPVTPHPQHEGPLLPHTPQRPTISLRRSRSPTSENTSPIPSTRRRVSGPQGTDNIIDLESEPEELPSIPAILDQLRTERAARDLQSSCRQNHGTPSLLSISTGSAPSALAISSASMLPPMVPSTGSMSSVAPTSISAPPLSSSLARSTRPSVPLTETTSSLATSSTAMAMASIPQGSLARPAPHEAAASRTSTSSTGPGVEAPATDDWNPFAGSCSSGLGDVPQLMPVLASTVDRTSIVSRTNETLIKRWAYRVQTGVEEAAARPVSIRSTSAEKAASAVFQLFVHIIRSAQANTDSVPPYTTPSGVWWGDSTGDQSVPSDLQRFLHRGFSFIEVELDKDNKPTLVASGPGPNRDLINALARCALVDPSLWTPSLTPTYSKPSLGRLATQQMNAEFEAAGATLAFFIRHMHSLPQGLHPLTYFGLLSKITDVENNTGALASKEVKPFDPDAAVQIASLHQLDHATALGPTDPLRFIIQELLDPSIDPQLLRPRSVEMHTAIVTGALCNMFCGTPQPSSHPHYVALHRGFHMLCGSGTNPPSIFSGTYLGDKLPMDFVQAAFQCVVSHPQTILDRIDFSCERLDSDNLQDLVFAMLFKMLFSRWILGVGHPELAALQGIIPPRFYAEQASHPMVRALLFVRTASGYQSQFLPKDLRFTVYFTPKPSTALRESHSAHLHARACFEEVEIPLTQSLRNVIRASADIDGNEPSDFDLWIHSLVVASAKGFNTI